MFSLDVIMTLRYSLLSYQCFIKQVLLYWKMIYKHNFSPHNIPLWN